MPWNQDNAIKTVKQSAVVQTPPLTRKKEITEAFRSTLRSIQLPPGFQLPGFLKALLILVFDYNILLCYKH